MADLDQPLHRQGDLFLKLADGPFVALGHVVGQPGPQSQQVEQRLDSRQVQVLGLFDVLPLQRIIERRRRQDVQLGGVDLLARDVEQGVCSIFLTLPMSRGLYLWGRFFGVVCSILPLLAGYIVSAAIAFIWAGNTWSGYVVAGSESAFSYGAVLILMPYLALTAVLFLIAAGATGTAEVTVFLFSVWLMCWALPPVLDALQNIEVADKTPAWTDTLLYGINQILPDLSSSRISLRLAHRLPLGTASVFGYCLQHLAYAALSIMAATALFSRRDLS